MTDVVLDVSDLCKRYGDSVPVLGGLDFSARRGEFLSVVGPSGCGKTTLLLALAGLLKVDSGSVSFRGTSVAGGTPKGVAIVFQDYSQSLFPWKTVKANVIFGMRRNTGVSKQRRDEIARELLDSMGLNGFENHYPWQLSGGMQQRVAIARGLASESELLLLDEPLAAVDAQTRADVQDLLLQVAQKFGQTCLLVTHDVDEAIYLADRVVVLSNRPTKVVEIIDVPLPKPRHQIESKEHPVFLRIRHEILEKIRAARASERQVAAT